MNANTDTADATFNDIDQYALHGRIVELDNSDDVLIPFSPVWNELAAREVQLDQLVRSGNVESALFRGCREVPRIMRLAESTASTTQMLLAMAAKCARQDLLAGSAAGHWSAWAWAAHGLDHVGRAELDAQPVQWPDGRHSACAHGRRQLVAGAAVPTFCRAIGQWPPGSEPPLATPDRSDRSPTGFHAYHHPTARH